MPNKSSVKKLPAGVVKAINFQLEKERLTLDDLVEWLGREHGYTISRSALGRYAKQYSDVREELKKSREVTEAFARELGPEAVEGQQGRLLVEMFQTLVFRLISGELSPKDALDAESEGFNSKDFMQLGRAIKDVAQANRFHQDFETKLREQIRAQEREKAAAEAAEVVDKALADEKGVTQETRDKIRLAIGVG